jgi:hypothetical protein
VERGELFEQFAHQKPAALMTCRAVVVAHQKRRELTCA